VKHRTATDERRTRAALHALGTLDAEEAREVDTHLREDCPTCAKESAGFATVTEYLALAAQPVPPAPALRERLLATARAQPSAPPPSAYSFVLAGDGAWSEVQPGVRCKDLAGDPTQPSYAYLVRMDVGAHVRTHEHDYVEHCYVVSGDLQVAGRSLQTGDYHFADRGTVHEDLFSETGCVLLIVESREAAQLS